MSIERIQTTNDVDRIYPESPNLEVVHKPYDCKVAADMPNLPSAKLIRRAQIQIPENGLEKQRQFNQQYRMLMQKFEMEIRQMKRQLGVSPQLNEDIGYPHGLTSHSPTFQDDQIHKAIGGSASTLWKDELLENCSNGGIDYQAELLKGDYNVIPETPVLGSKNLVQNYRGEILTSNNEEILKELYDFYNRQDIGDEKQGASLAYSNLAQCVNSFNVPWGEKTFEHQKFKAELFKTEMCRSWAKFGLCPYGESCRFAHGQRELRMRPKPHWKYKTEMCKKFLAGFCPYGSRCNFVHIPYEQHRAMVDGRKYFGITADQSIREYVHAMAQISYPRRTE